MELETKSSAEYKEAFSFFVFVWWKNPPVNCFCVFGSSAQGTPKPKGLNAMRLSAEAVQSASLALEGVHDVHGRDGLAAGVLGVGDRVADHGLKEDLEDTAGLLVDEAGDALDATTARKAADGRLGDALDVVAKHLAVTLGAALAESFTSLTTSRHD